VPCTAGKGVTNDMTGVEQVSNVAGTLVREGASEVVNSPPAVQRSQGSEL
jgi:hypothetical protein